MKQQLRDVSNAPTDTGEDDEEADEKNHRHRQREGARKSTRRGGATTTATVTTQHHHHNHQMPSSLNDNANNNTTANTTGEKRWQVKSISPTDENSLFFVRLSCKNLNFSNRFWWRGDFSSKTTRENQSLCCLLESRDEQRKFYWLFLSFFMRMMRM